MNVETAQNSPAPQLSVIIPAYNEARRIGATLAKLQQFSRDAEYSLEVIVVDDGSRDATADVVRRFPAAAEFDLRLLTGEPNRGKGYSVRRGMLEARGQMLLMSDADLSTPLEELAKLTPHLREGFGVVIASRAMADSKLDPPQPPIRRVMDVGFRMLRRMIMLPDIRDTQCGFKLFSRHAARQIFTRLETEGFAFDCEALGLARQMGVPIKEVGVLWRNDRASTVRPVRDSIAMLMSLLKIRRRLGRTPGTIPTARPAPASQHKSG